MRGTTGARGTRVPAAAAAVRQYSRPLLAFSGMWPGTTWGDDARCSCTWGYLGGIRQVKVRHAACTVHASGRIPEAAR